MCFSFHGKRCPPSSRFIFSDLASIGHQVSNSHFLRSGCAKVSNMLVDSAVLPSGRPLSIMRPSSPSCVCRNTYAHVSGKRSFFTETSGGNLNPPRVFCISFSSSGCFRLPQPLYSASLYLAFANSPVVMVMNTLWHHITAICLTPIVD